MANYQPKACHNLKYKFKMQNIIKLQAKLFIIVQKSQSLRKRFNFSCQCAFGPSKQKDVISLQANYFAFLKKIDLMKKIHVRTMETDEINRHSLILIKPEINTLDLPDPGSSRIP